MWATDHRKCTRRGRTKEWAKHVTVGIVFQSSESLFSLIKWRKRETREEVSNGYCTCSSFPRFSKMEMAKLSRWVTKPKREEAAHQCHLEVLMVLQSSPWATGAPMDGKNTDRAKGRVEETTQSQELDFSFSNSRTSGGSRNKNIAMSLQIYVYFVCFQKVDK